MWQTLGEQVTAAYGGDLAEYLPEVTSQVAHALQLNLGAALTTHLANGGSEADFINHHSAALPEYTRIAVRDVQEARSLVDMRRQAHAHYRTGR